MAAKVYRSESSYQWVWNGINILMQAGLEHTSQEAADGVTNISRCLIRPPPPPRVEQQQLM